MTSWLRVYILQTKNEHSKWSISEKIITHKETSDIFR